MEKANQEVNLPKIAKEIQISFERSFTISDFIKEIKEKMIVFDSKKEEKNKKANLNMINIYRKDLESNINQILYEYKITYNNKQWS